MAQDLTLKVAGLYTDLNPLQEIPNGALKVADNIQIRRRGTAERRPGFPRTLAPTDAERVDGIFPFEGDWTAFIDLGGSQGWVTSADAQISVDGGVSYVVGELHAAEMQKRLYVTLEDYVARYQDAGDTSAARAGMEQPGQARAAATQDSDYGWLSSGSQVGYRVVLAKTIDGQLLLSAPSAPSYMMPTSDYITDATATEFKFYVSLDGRVPPGADPGDEIHIYRTLTADSITNPDTPGDEMRLLTSFELPSPTGSTWSFDDFTPDTQLTGASLYTNATQQGILLSNGVPPRVGCITTFSDMMFAGNTSTGSELALSQTSSPSEDDFDYANPNALWPGLQVADDQAVVAFTNAAPTITITGTAADAMTFEVQGSVSGVGGNFYTTDADFTNDTRITVVVQVAGLITLTLNKNPLAAAGTSFSYFKPGILQSTNIFGGYQQWQVGDSFMRLTDLADDGFTYLSDYGVGPGVAGTYFSAGTQITDQIVEDGYPTSFGTYLSAPLLAVAPSGESRASIWSVLYDADYGVGPFTVVTIALGAPTIAITGPAAAFEYSVGQEITDWDAAPQSVGATWAAGTEILSINRVSSSNVTLTCTTNALQNEEKFAVWDWIAIDGLRRYGCQKPLYDLYSPNGNLFLYDRSVLWSLQDYASPNTFLFANDYIAIQAYGGGSDPRSIIYGETSDSTAAPFTITSSKPSAFADEVDPVTGVDSEPSVNLNRLVWSKVQEPDAWPIAYFADIGQASARILRVLATRESLFVFKEDGTWRVTGTSPETLRVDEYDRTLKLIHPNAVSRIDNNLMGWFVSGAMLVTDAQTSNVSDNMVGEDLSDIREAPEGSPWSPDVFSFTVERDNQWHLITGDGSGEPALLLYVFNLITRAWTTWTLAAASGLSCGVDNEPDAKILLGGASSATGVVFEEASAVDPQYDDVTSSLTPLTITQGDAMGEGFPYVMTVAAPVSLDAGTVLEIAGDYFIVYATVSAVTTFTTWSEALAAPVPAAATVYAPIDAAIEWTAKTQQNPGVRKHFRESNMTFQRFEDMRVFDLKYSTDRTDDETVSGDDFDDHGGRPFAVRAWVPRNAARAFWLNPRIDIPYVLSDFRLDGCSIVYEWMNERTGR